MRIVSPPALTRVGIFCFVDEVFEIRAGTHEVFFFQACSVAFPRLVPRLDGADEPPHSAGSSYPIGSHTWSHMSYSSSTSISRLPFSSSHISCLPGSLPTRSASSLATLDSSSGCHLLAIVVILCRGWLQRRIELPASSSSVAKQFLAGSNFFVFCCQN